MDAHYSYSKDLNLILEACADYIVGIKGNQANLSAEIKNYFEQARAIQYDSNEFKCYTTIDKGHGRIENHWLIENDLHYVADVIFEEDAALTNTGNAAETIALFRRLAMNIVRTFDTDRGMADARRNAMFEPAYLRGLLWRLFAKNC